LAPSQIAVNKRPAVAALEIRLVPGHVKVRHVSVHERRSAITQPLLVVPVGDLERIKVPKIRGEGVVFDQEGFDGFRTSSNRLPAKPFPLL
jgi:hypothetical protein